MEAFSIRDAQLSDCMVTARFVSESSESAANYLVTLSCQSEAGIEQVVSDRLAREVLSSCVNTVLAHITGKVIGAA